MTDEPMVELRHFDAQVYRALAAEEKVEQLRNALTKLAGIVIADGDAMDSGYVHYDTEYEGIVRDRASAAVRILGELGIDPPPSPYVSRGLDEEEAT